MFSIKIDNRESKIKDILPELKLPVSYENLVHGDVQILMDDKPIFIFERKSIDDLIASIKDGRYKNQKMVLFQSGYVASQIYYIIEGNICWNKESAQVKGAVINTLLRDKIGIFYTKNVGDTVNFLLEMIQRVSKEPKKYVDEKSSERKIITMSQCDKNTPEICFINMLCQIPSINEKTAKGIAIRYKTMRQLIVEGDEKTLSEIKINGRKISSKVVENILNYLLKSL